MELPRLKIGLNDYVPVYAKDRYTSILLMGKSGSGKSAWMSQAWQQDCFFPVAKVMIEPSGFLAKDCYSLSKGKAHYCSLDTPVSINPMQTPYDPNQISDNIAEALNQVVQITTPNTAFTVKMRGILDTAVKWCLGNNRRNLLAVRDYIANLKGDGETRDGVIQRLNFLLNDDRMLPILCGNNAVEWGKLIDKGETFILDAFGMGREKMLFAGNLISQGIKNYFRYERPAVYKPLALYIDECHLFVNYNILDVLKEGRKYKLGCVMATQDFATVEEKLVRVMLNVGTILSFRLGAREAGLIAREIACQPQILQFLEKYHLVYLTPQERGIAQASRPPLFRKLTVGKKVGPQRKSGWFVLEFYPG